jgi:DNA-damage-inducible protein J
MPIVLTTGMFCSKMQVSKLTCGEVKILSNASMNIRMDSEVKKQAQELFAQFGLDMTTAVNMFLRQSIRQQGIPFALQLDPFYSEANQIRLKQAAERMERTGGTVHEIADVEND